MLLGGSQCYAVVLAVSRTIRGLQEPLAALVTRIVIDSVDSVLLGAPSEQADDLRLDVNTGGCLDQQIGQLPIIRGQELRPIDPVSVE